MRTQKSRGCATAMLSHQHLPRFSLHSQRKKEGVIKGKLRIRSIPGAFLVLGVVVVIVGTALAVAGYWPYRTHQLAVSDGLSGTSQTSGWSVGPKGLFTAASFIHSERLKLLGPVIMGVGLFILICANTVLYENRDRETQMLLAQMRSVICSVSAAVPSTDLMQMNSLARHYQWVSSLPASHLNILCLQEVASSEPLLQVKTTKKDEGIQERTLLCTEVHHQECSATPSINSSNSCNSKLDFNTVLDAEQGAFCDQMPETKSNCKLNNCSMSIIEGENWEFNTLSPRRSYSMCYRTKPQTLPRALIHLNERDEQPIDHPRQDLQQSVSEVCVNMRRIETVTFALDLRPMVEQRHCSWPRLDLGYTRKYLKLENKEDSVDKLLDYLEQQCSELGWSFGSGPFQ